MSRLRHIATAPLTTCPVRGACETHSQLSFHDFSCGIPGQCVDDFQRLRMLVAGQSVVEELGEVSQLESGLADGGDGDRHLTPLLVRTPDDSDFDDGGVGGE